MNNLLNNNNFVRIVSVLMAVVLWVYVVYQQNPPAERDLIQKPIIRQLSDSLVIKDGITDVKIKLRGKRSDIMGLAASDIKVYLDMGAARAGVNQVPVKVTVPTGVEVVDVEPQLMPITMESIKERQFSVVMNSTGMPATGYVAQSPLFDQSIVAVRGPVSSVDAIARVVVDVSLAGATKDVTGTYRVRIYDHSGNLINNLRTTPGQIKVVVPVKKEATTQIGKETPPTTGGEQSTGGTKQDNKTGDQTENKQSETPTPSGQ